MFRRKLAAQRLENMAKHAKKKSGNDGYRLEQQDDCCQWSCQLKTNHRLMFRMEREEQV